MGIKGLTKFLSEHADKAVRKITLESLAGSPVAVDASLSLYQFIIAIREDNSYGNLTNASGEVTSHIAGFLSRVVRLLENGIKPIYVFDGAAAKLKSGELEKRRERREEAEVKLAESKEAGDIEGIKKYSGRVVRVTKEQNEDVITLLNLLGVPVVRAPSEAEAQCAWMAKEGVVNCTVTEDMDCLCFGCPIVIRHLDFAPGKDKSILSINLDKALTQLDFTMEQFIDFCILCGCDYTDKIKGIGPVSAFKLIKKYKSIDGLLENRDKLSEKLIVPRHFPYSEARAFFQAPDVTFKSDIGVLHWTPPDEAGLTAFLVGKHSFNESRVQGYLKRLAKCKQTGTQLRLESFFTKTPTRPKEENVTPVTTIKAIKKTPKGRLKKQ